MLPTPTALPAGTNMITALHASDWRIWNYTDEAIQIWNGFGTGASVIQWAVVIVIVIAFVALMIKLVQGYMHEGDSNS